MRIAMSEQRVRQNNSIRRNNAPPPQSRSSVSFSGRKGGTILPEGLISLCQNVDGFKQRLALGVAALIFQPIIDYYNPMADEKTRKYSVLKSVVKAVVGTTTGLLIRGLVRKQVVKSLEKPDKFLSRIKDPKLASSVKEILNDASKKARFTDNFATVCGLVGVAIGDFTFDMPLARFSIHKTADVLGMSETDKGDKK